MPLEMLLSLKLSEAQFNEISDMVKGLCGINLHDGKKELVKARLTKRLRKLHFHDFAEYIAYVTSDTSGIELTAMLDALSTNLTSFFREPEHLDYLGREVIPRIIAKASKATPRLRIWSAGCSSGEEPYSIAVTASEAYGHLPLMDARILATDLSTRMLARATRGVYDGERIKGLSPCLRARYFRCVQTRPERLYRVNDCIRSLVHFARLNLMDHWPMRGPLDAIFCRNVMIYFDKPTQRMLIGRFSQLLASGGTLFIGHSESLTGIRHQFRYVQPTVYEKP